MNPVRRFFRRYIVSTIGIVLLFFTVNLLLFLAVLSAGYLSGTKDIFSVERLSEHIGPVPGRDGVWEADETARRLLEENDAWAMVLDAGGNVVWELGLPEELPRAYTSAQVAAFSRWYLEGYPVKVWVREDGFLAVAGFPPGTWVKYYFTMERPYVDIIFIGGASVFLMNLGLLLFLILRGIRRVEKAMSPILQGIQELGRGKPCRLKEQGELAEISAGLNRAGDYMKRKDNTRAEWIRGISHDIRTPLSMVLGYAGELEEDDSLPPQARQQAGIIRRQGERLKALVESLNLTTRLEYALRPIRLERLDAVELGRQAVSGVLNEGLPAQYEMDFSREDFSGADFDWEKIFPGQPERTAELVGDPDLLRRMLDNLINNSIVHNPQGCHISVQVGMRAALRENRQERVCCFTVTDDGRGMPGARLERLNREQGGTERGPEEETGYDPEQETNRGPEHGLGLRIVGQIVRAHGGTLKFSPVSPHGLCVRACFPINGQDGLSESGEDVSAAEGGK